MRRTLVISLVAAVIAALGVGLTSTPAAQSAGRDPDPLDVYTAVVQPDQLSSLAQQGLDVSAQRKAGSNIAVDLVLDGSRPSGSGPRASKLDLTRVKGGKTLRQFAAAQAVDGYTVWRSYDEPGGIRDQMYAIATANPQLVKLEVIGTTAQGREILAIKLTQGAARRRTEHARRCSTAPPSTPASGSPPRSTGRLMNYYIDKWRANDRSVRKLLQATELWFMPVANPDGYQYTFDHERLWRKNLRDNNGDGQTRRRRRRPEPQLPEHWGYDDEGSSPIPSSDTYRGPAPASEPETQAMVGPPRPHQLQVPGQLPLQRPVAALPGGLADRHADRGRPDLLRAVRQPRQAGDRGLPPGPELGRPLRHQRRDDRLRAQAGTARWPGRRS